MLSYVRILEQKHIAKADTAEPPQPRIYIAPASLLEQYGGLHTRGPTQTRELQKAMLA